MYRKVRSIARHPLITGSSIIFVGTLIANIFNYLFNLLMGHKLSVPDYGLLTTLSSIFILAAIFALAFGNVIARYSARYFANGNTTGARAVLVLGSRFVFIFGLGLTVVLSLLIPFLTKFLHVDNPLYVFIIIIAVFFALLLALPTGYIQGRLKFYLLSASAISQPVIKVIAALALLSLGFSLYGPLLALILASAIPFIFFSYYLWRDHRRTSDLHDFDHALFKKEFIHDTSTFFLSAIGFTLLQNADIILVRHFLGPFESGQYAALSLMGKAIFYFTTPVNAVFFPLISMKKERKERLLPTLTLALGVVAIAAGAIALFYALFPKVVLAVFFPGSGYAVLQQYLGFFALYIVVLCLASLLNSFFLSIGKTGVFKIALAAALLQIGAIFLFHESLFQIITVLFSISLLLLTLLIGYYVKYAKD